MRHEYIVLTVAVNSHSIRLEIPFCVDPMGRPACNMALSIKDTINSSLAKPESWRFESSNSDSRRARIQTMNFIDDAESARSNDDNGTVATEDTITPLQRRLAAGLNGLSTTRALMDAGLTISDLDEGILAASEHARNKVGTEDIEIEFMDSEDNVSILETSFDECATETATDDTQSEDGKGRGYSNGLLFHDYGMHSNGGQPEGNESSVFRPHFNSLSFPGYSAHRRTVNHTQSEDPMVKENDRIKRERQKQMMQAEMAVVSDEDTMHPTESIDSFEGVRRSDYSIVRSFAATNSSVDDFGKSRSFLRSKLTGETLGSRLGNPPTISSRDFTKMAAGCTSLEFSSRSTRNVGLPASTSQHQNIFEPEMKDEKQECQRPSQPEESNESSTQARRAIQTPGTSSKQREVTKAEIQTELAMFQTVALLERESRRPSRIRPGDVNLDYECERPGDNLTTARGVVADVPIHRNSLRQSKQIYVRSTSTPNSNSGRSLLLDDYAVRSARSLRESEGQFHIQRNDTSLVSNDKVSRRSLLQHTKFRPLYVSQSARHLSSDGSGEISRTHSYFQKRDSLDNLEASQLLSRSQSIIGANDAVPSELTTAPSSTTRCGEERAKLHLDRMRGRKGGQFAHHLPANEYDRTPRASSRRNLLESTVELPSLQQDSSQPSSSHRSYERSHHSQRRLSYHDDRQYNRSLGSIQESRHSQSLRSFTLDSQHSRSQRGFEESQRSRTYPRHKGQEIRIPSETDDPSRSMRAIKSSPSCNREGGREQVNDPPFYSRESSRSLIDVVSTTGLSPSAIDDCGTAQEGGSSIGQIILLSRHAEYENDNECINDQCYSFAAAPRLRSSEIRERNLPITCHNDDEDPLEDRDHEHRRRHPNQHAHSQHVDRYKLHSLRPPDRRPRESISLDRCGGEQARNRPSHGYQLNHQQQLQHQYRPGHAEVEIGPGVWRKLRGADETWEAVMTGNYVPTECLDCNLMLLVIANAQLVLCPGCRVVSPILDDGSGFAVTSCSTPSCPTGATNSRNGIGLGFLVRDLMKWQGEMKRGIDPRFGGSIQ